MRQETPQINDTFEDCVSKRRLNQRASGWEYVSGADRKLESVWLCLVTREHRAVLEVNGLQGRAARKHLEVA